MRLRLVGLVMMVMAAFAPAHAQKRWTPKQANDWYARQPWLVGANFVPSDAINQLEMFQAATFNPALNDHELGLAEAIGMNTMRVFLQDQLWEQDPQGFTKRLDTFLADRGETPHSAIACIVRLLLGDGPEARTEAPTHPRHS